MFATVDPVFRGRGPRNQFIPAITEENLQDNAYVNMKRGGKVVKKKGKTTATATAVVNVYTGRRGRRRGPVQPRPAPQIIQIRDSVNPYLQGFAPVRREEPFGPSRMRDNSGSSSDIRMEQIDTSRFLPFGITQPLQMLSRETVPVRQQLPFEFVSQGQNPVDPFRLLPFNAEPYEPIEMKHEKEPDELIKIDELFLEEADLLPLPREEPPEEKAAQDAGGEPRRRRRTKEELEQAKLESDIRQVELRQEILKGLMDRLSEERLRKPDSPFIKKLEKDIAKFIAKR